MMHLHPVEEMSRRPVRSGPRRPRCPRGVASCRTPAEKPRRDFRSKEIRWSEFLGGLDSYRFRRFPARLRRHRPVGGWCNGPQTLLGQTQANPRVHPGAIGFASETHGWPSGCPGPASRLRHAPECGQFARVAAAGDEHLQPADPHRALVRFPGMIPPPENQTTRTTSDRNHLNAGGQRSGA